MCVCQCGLIRERGKGAWRCGGGGEEGDYIPLSLRCHHQNYSCIKMGSDESHFNVPVGEVSKLVFYAQSTGTVILGRVSVGSDGQGHRTVSTNHDLFEEKGEPKWYRTEVLPLTTEPKVRS